MFAHRRVEHFLLCMIHARVSVAAHVGAKEEQRCFSTVLCGTVGSLEVVTLVSYGVLDLPSSPKATDWSA